MSIMKLKIAKVGKEENPIMLHFTSKVVYEDVLFHVTYKRKDLIILDKYDGIQDERSLAFALDTINAFLR